MQLLRDATLAKQVHNEAKDCKRFTHDAVRDMAVNNLNRRIYMAHKHSTDTYNAATAELESAANRMYSALNTLIECEKETTEKAKQAIGRAKDSAAQIGDALARVNKLIGTDFESRLAQLERTATALEKLAELDKAGKLAGVIAALKG
jgi:ABC-type transporter Mla subunit MlaD